MNLTRLQVLQDEIEKPIPSVYLIQSEHGVNDNRLLFRSQDKVRVHR